jgi:hypothetical protein
MKVIGFEAANSYVKIKTDDSQEAYFNCLWEIPADYLSNIMGTRGTKEQIAQYDGRSFKVGERLDGYVSSSSRSADRYATPEYKREALFALARHASAVDLDEGLHVVTAVPSDHYKMESVTRDIEKQLRDVHALTVNGSSLLLPVKKVGVILQPVATVISVAFNPDGSLRNGAVAKNRKIVIDIGWGTTDIAVMRGLALIKYFTVNTSMIDVYRYINTQLRKRPRFTDKSFTLFDIEEQLRGESSIFSWGGVSVDCSDNKAAAMQQVAEEIISKIQNEVNLSDTDLVLFGGGGIEALAPHMKKHVEGVNAQRVTDPQIANAVGCYIYGKSKNR